MWIIFLVLISGDSSFVHQSPNVNIKNGTMVFNPVNVDASGEYTCQAENGVGQSLIKKISIVVLGKKRIIPGFKDY